MRRRKAPAEPDDRAPRILHLSESDTQGGANRAAVRLHRALLAAGMESVYAAGRRHLDADDIVPAGPGAFAARVFEYANAATAKPFRRRDRRGFVTPSVFTYGRLKRHLIESADIVCLHWIAGAFLKAGRLGILRHKPVVWRLSDLWPFTGGCHYPGDCRGYERRCGGCPQLGSRIEWDITRHGWRSRARGYRDLDLTVVAPSRWIAHCAGASSLFANRPIEVIPTGVDTDLFRPRDRSAARAELGLPAERDLILFGALGATDDPRKGFAQLAAALRQLAGTPAAKNAALVVFGSGEGAHDPSAEGGLPTTMLGRIDEPRRLAALYAAADVLVCPSLEDNLPNVALEALAAGTPVAAFAIGGMPDIVDDRICGRLARAVDPAALAEAVGWLLDAKRTGADLGKAAREKAISRFDLKHCAQRYRDLFTRIMAARRSAAARL